MTKAKARERAKAKAAQKTKKRKAADDQTPQSSGPEKFGQDRSSISSPRTPNSHAFTGARRGAARSR